MTLDEIELRRAALLTDLEGKLLALKRSAIRAFIQCFCVGYACGVATVLFISQWVW